ncbi:MAG: hypothetical protein A3H98_02040 [Bacteroidetes bacterium RIFCSPLOWO2_02_FULL_36_8]|nr:MAG: hypothetical protein A3H98_02040 [Bacteroidetes bacterium RIFCSPLOWO2_02_FULL_36_8]OFY69477.1 MAG: hypothetical protein A3G23_10585 [Bacteroidetes bacterium RIFCSPLOWO2_12_FULL_37_12]
MNLALDSGNSLTKIGLFKNDKLIKTSALKFNEKLLIRKILSLNPGHIILSSVGNDLNGIYKQLKKTIPTFVLRSSSKFPFKNLYKSPKTLGNDRLALAAGAVTLYPHQNCLVISAGTCITYNFINSDTEFIGGAISPGIKMRLDVLHSQTALLPLIKKLTIPPLVGKTTKESIQGGALYGICQEIGGIAKLYRTAYSDLKVILCGGDAEFLKTFIDVPLRVHPHLGMHGLNKILEMETFKVSPRS